MLNVIKKRIQRYLSLINDPMRKDKSKGTYYEKYGFSVGKYTYGHQQFFQESINLKEIGSFCSIAKNVVITGMNHPTNYITTNPIIYFKSRGFIKEDRLDLINKDKNKKVIIGNDVWIGTNVTILPSVKIGNGAIVGAGSVVTKDIPDYAIVVGVPAKVIGYRFDENEIKLLNESKWWDWPNEKIKSYINDFVDKEKFLKILNEEIHH